MDYDDSPPMPVDRYLEAQRVIPGVETLYAVLRSVLDANCAPGARVLVIGAGGGREVEALLPSPRRYRLLGIDPSADMLAIAKGFVTDDARVELRQAMLEDVPERDFDAATCCLVMHFLPDDGTKLAFLRKSTTASCPARRCCSPMPLSTTVRSSRHSTARWLPMQGCRASTQPFRPRPGR